MPCGARREKHSGQRKRRQVWLGVTGSGVRGRRLARGELQVCGPLAVSASLQGSGRGLAPNWATVTLAVWGAESLCLRGLTGLCFLLQDQPRASMGA